MASANDRTSATNVHNQLLAAWPSEVWAHVGSDLERVELVQGQTLHEAGTALKYVYFPISAVVSLVSGMQDGGSAEVAVVGHEGVVGVCAFMDGALALSGGEVQTAGHAWRMRAPVLANHVARHAAMALPLLRYTQALLVQLAQTAACNRHHSLHQQLCRWLLLHQDRHRCDEFLVTHERMSNLLGVRRETVTACALKLQKSGWIRYGRGRLAILDRRGLEGESCECYAVVRSAYDRLHSSHLTAPLATVHRHGDHCRTLPNVVSALRQPGALVALQP